MATGISSAERLPDADYSVPHRTPPPIPSLAYSHHTANISSSPPLSEPGAASANPALRSRGSLRSLLRRMPSQSSSSNQRSTSSNNDNVPPVPSIPAEPATRITQAAVSASQSGRSNSILTSNNRKISGEGRNMLRKSSKMKAQEKERMEQERMERQQQPPPRLPSHNPLPGIASFGASTTNLNNINDSNPSYSNSNNTANFSRPGNTYASMPSSSYNSSSSPAYAIRGATPSSPPSGKTNGEYVERAESMTNRGRYSYASSANHVNVSSPRRVRRRKDPTPFNVLVIGAKNSGKTSLISFLRHSLALPSNKNPSLEPDSSVKASKSSFTSHYLETEMDGERVGLTLWDSAGLEKNIVDLQLREMATFVESKFEETFVEEQKVMRSPGVKDTHIHCAFLVLDPIRLDATIAASSALQKGGMNLMNASGLDDELDLQVMRALWGKTTVIPVIAKADTLTMGHMGFLKRAVWQSIKAANVDPLEALELEDDIEEESEEDEEDADSDVIDNLLDRSDSESSTSPPAPRSAKKTHKRQSSLTVTAIKASPDDDTPYIPMSILSPDPYDLPPYPPAKSTRAGDNKVGRRFPWGFADPYNAEHCDFTRLRDSIFMEWRGELRELSRSKWYENWRTSRLKNLPGSTRRIKGGVTPMAAIPREGRTSPRPFSPTGAVPRSVSGTAGGQLEPPLEGRNSASRGVSAQ
ncbi:hypothetical protein LTR37_018910 [Vermiconidia calcicola]|uniref:Uncharacterized protein n=1 Tax=Vermiconidia calcicola TaxID=1690605 RepID=A0ACC3MHK8_9PEZI|nr:hypothetical protein LTR37_018910 [Vermiconidia calcicola]